MNEAKFSVSLHSITGAQNGSGRSVLHNPNLESIRSREFNGRIVLFYAVVPN